MMRGSRLWLREASSGMAGWASSFGGLLLRREEPNLPEIVYITGEAVGIYSFMVGFTALMEGGCIDP
jgi:hypothetical protein